MDRWRGIHTNSDQKEEDNGNDDDDDERFCPLRRSGRYRPSRSGAGRNTVPTGLGSGTDGIPVVVVVVERMAGILVAACVWNRTTARGPSDAVLRILGISTQFAHQLEQQHFLSSSRSAFGFIADSDYG